MQVRTITIAEIMQQIHDMYDYSSNPSPANKDECPHVEDDTYVIGKHEKGYDYDEFKQYLELAAFGTMPQEYLDVK